jgi:hypothetical protein
MPEGYAIVPGQYAFRSWGVRYFFLDGTLLMKPDRLVFHGRYAICCSCAGPIFQEATLYTSRHIFRAFDSPFFISGTLFLQSMFGMGKTKVSWAVRYSRSSRTLISARVGEWTLFTNIVEQKLSEVLARACDCLLRLQGLLLLTEALSTPPPSRLTPSSYRSETSSNS